MTQKEPDQTARYWNQVFGKNRTGIPQDQADKCRASIARGFQSLASARSKKAFLDQVDAIVNQPSLWEDPQS